MNFKKKLKIRLALAVGLLVLGVLIIVFSNVFKAENDSLWGIGLGFAVCGIARIHEYFRITKNEDTIKMRRIAESDERNIMIASKARSIAFYAYIMISGVAMLCLTAMNKADLAVPYSISVCFLVAIYYISFFIVRKLH